MFDRADPAAIERHAKRLVNRRLGDLIEVPAGVYQHGRNRGSIGGHYEAYFGVSANSEAAPDLPEAGVELKAVPMKRSGSGRYSPKERTFITAIDYASILDQDFEGSPLDTKTRRTLYLFYEHDRDVELRSFRTLGILLHERDELDELVLRDAHAHVKRMVAAGRAHEISEADTFGVGAATKDARARDVPQPHSSVPARRRAFAWKPAVTERLWHAAKPRSARPLTRTTAPDDVTAFRRDVLERIQPWIGIRVGQLRDRFLPGASDDYKALTSAVSRRILDTADERATEAFDRLGITVRTMRVDPRTSRPREAVSFRAFDPVELAQETWDTSDLLSQLRSFFFVVFDNPSSDPISEATLRGGFFWEPSHRDLEVMGDEWTSFRDAIARSAVGELPTSRETEILHVRPHGRDSRDRLPLPDGTPYQRSSFWLNQSYLQRLVQTHLEA